MNAFAFWWYSVSYADTGTGIQCSSEKTGTNYPEDYGNSKTLAKPSPSPPFFGTRVRVV